MGERRGERDADVNPPRPRDARKAEALLSDPITNSIASASPDSIMLLDREGRIRFINHPAPTLTNEQVLGTSVYDYVSADQHAAMRACFEYVLATGQPSRYDNVFRPPDEAASFWESRVGAVKEGGAITGLVVIASNVTERRGAAADRDLFFKLSLDLYCVADPARLLPPGEPGVRAHARLVGGRAPEPALPGVRARRGPRAHGGRRAAARPGPERPRLRQPVSSQGWHLHRPVVARYKAIPRRR